MVNCNLHCIDYNYLPSNTFTHTNYGTSWCKWLDHCIGRGGDGITVENVKVMYDMIASDHLPMVIQFNIPFNEHLKNVILEPARVQNSYVEWNILSEGDIQNIAKDAHKMQGSYRNLPVRKCQSLGCNDIECIKMIDLMYDTIVDSVNQVSNQFIKNKINPDKYKVIPGWNRAVKQLYEQSRNHYLQWLSYDKPREGIHFENMKNSRSLFKKALKECKENEANEVSLSIQHKFQNKDMNAFWKEVKKKNNHKKNISTVIDNASNSSNIIDIFVDKFLKGSNSLDVNETDIVSELNQKWSIANKVKLCISLKTFKDIASSLHKGVGHDGLHSRLLCVDNSEFIQNTVDFLNCCFNQCYFPSRLLQGEIKPIIKNPKGDKQVSSNYRPIMVSSSLLKVAETHILSHLEEKISLNKLQFGFTKNSSTTDACFLLKEVVGANMGEKGAVYASFIDLSKAFDMVDHAILIKKLIDSELAIDIVLLIASYIRNQTARIVWDGQRGDFEHINAGVRQGGIMSPFLFNFYMDELLKTVSSLDCGCKLGVSRVNIVAYADDVAILANSAEQLNEIYSLFKVGIDMLGLKINEDKSNI